VLRGIERGSVRAGKAIVMKSAALIATLLAIIGVAGCANCEWCKTIPGWDGRYATHDAGDLNRKDRSGLPVTPYVPR
jgi:hypothetical protein